MHDVTPAPFRCAGRPGAPRLRLLAAAGLLMLAGCGPPVDEGGDITAARDGSAHPMVGRRAPDFVGDTRTPGGWLPLTGMRDQPVAMLFFRLDEPFVPELVRKFDRFFTDRAFASVRIMGIVPDSAEAIQRFQQHHRLKLPLLRDPGSIRRSYDIGGMPTVVLLDADHVIRFRLDGFMGREFLPRIEATEAVLRKLPDLMQPPARPLELSYGPYPRAPYLSGRSQDGQLFDLAALRGSIVVMLFFNLACDPCERDLPPVIAALNSLRSHGVTAVGIVPGDPGAGLPPMLARLGFDFPTLVDPSRTMMARYGSTRLPDSLIIDRQGFIRFRAGGGAIDAEPFRLQLRVVLGDEDPARLAAGLPGGRTLGLSICATCHAAEYHDWLQSPHSVAWDSLHEGSRWRDPECTTCHVTRQGEPGGFVDSERTPGLVNVQCESCHGTGGGHTGGAVRERREPAETCRTCHTDEFPLRHDLDEAIALVAHRDPPDSDRLFSYSEKQLQRLRQVNTVRLAPLRSGVNHVGGTSCRECHREQHEQWRETPHAAAFTRLLRIDREGDDSCLPCHTTGFGRPGGFDDRFAKAAMTNVQCEVCHGPGEDHVTFAGATGTATIYGLSGDCTLCDTEQLCRSCHDRQNDPEFDFARALPQVLH